MLRLIFVICFFMMQVAYSLPSDKEKPAYITADSATLNQKTGIEIFKGHAKVDQGTTHLTADTIIAYLNKRRKPIKIVAIGSLKQPAHYQTLPKEKQTLFDAWAVRIEYYPQKKLAYLIDHAIAHQAPNTFTGSVIRYDMYHQVVQSYPDKQAQTTITLYPNKIPS